MRRAWTRYPTQKIHLSCPTSPAAETKAKAEAKVEEREDSSRRPPPRNPRSKVCLCVRVWLWACEADVSSVLAWLYLLGYECFWVCSLSAAPFPLLSLHKIEDVSKPPAKPDSGVHMESVSSSVAGMPAVCAVLLFLHLRILDFTNGSVAIRIGGTRARLCTACPPTVPTGACCLLLCVS